MSGGIAYVLDPDGRLPGPLQHRARRPRGRGRGRRHRAARADRRAPRAHRLGGGGARARQLRRAPAARSSRSSRATTSARWPSCRKPTARATRAWTSCCPRPRRRRARTTHMGELGGFLKVHRVGFDKRDPHARVHDYKQYFRRPARGGAARAGRALHGLRHPVLPRGLPARQPDPGLERPRAPRQRWREAIDQLHATNNFPEFTGLICPAPCESACVLDDQRRPGDDRADRAGDRRARLRGGLGRARPARARAPARRVAVVGSGPAGLAVAAELNKRGHRSPSTSATRAPAA